MNTTEPKVVTRYAPSPTGFQHIGGIRTALFAYLWARKNHGTFILRIEDTDKNREVAGAIEHTKNALAWLGIDYDFGPDAPGPFGSCIQSERLDRYRHYAEQLVAKGLAYPDPYSTEEVQAFRDEATAANQPFLFRNHRPDTTTAWDGTTPLRFKVPEIKRYTWHDAVRGELSAGEEMLDDFIIMKADGYPTYNFAHIIDDYEMGVTHVMRGEEFIASTPKFLSLYDALEIAWPVFVTLPPIMGPDGKKKLSKRDGAKDILEYKTDGYLPEALRNFLALIGWNPGGEQELFPGDELIQAFTLEKIQRSGGAFNEEKLRWMNRQYLHTMSDTDFFTYCHTALPARVVALDQYSDERLMRLLPTIKERIDVAHELTTEAEAGEYDWAFSRPTVEPVMLKWKNDPDENAAYPRLTQTTALLAEADFSTPESIKATLWPYAESEGKGEVLWPLRVALTGKERSPDPFTVAYVLGQTETLRRIETVLPS